MYKILWKHNVSHKTGEGEACLTLKQAQAWVVKANADNPEITHWYEHVSDCELENVESDLAL